MEIKKILVMRMMMKKILMRFVLRLKIPSSVSFNVTVCCIRYNLIASCCMSLDMPPRAVFSIQTCGSTLSNQ